MYFHAMVSGTLEFMGQTMTSLLIVTFISIKRLSLPYLMHFAEFDPVCYSARFLLLVPIFLVY
jgi:hypothetical protein